MLSDSDSDAPAGQLHGGPHGDPHVGPLGGPHGGPRGGPHGDRDGEADAHGGDRILEKITAVHGDVFRHRPVLTKPDWALMLFRSLMS